ncbi:hypothetical protein Taro_052813 [Colocasia esculenta]|uniref:Aminotransferase-like plant mobile domain-containing protein n=1 Tax=Colocasia esculenta TaxID=4460 RepID=A0A843XKT0_COLES|nr:hypothetical protein [Colocasia esculenta]
MGFGVILKMDRMRSDPALTQALRSRWDSEVTAFVFPWGHMIPSLEDVSRVTGLRVFGRPVIGFTYPGYSELAHRLLGLTVEARSSLVPRVALQESLGLYDVDKQVGETVDGQLQRLTRGCRAVLAEEPGVEANLDLRRFLILFLGRLLFAMRGDALERLRAADVYEWLLPFSPGLNLPSPPGLEEGDSGATGPRAHSSPLGPMPRHAHLERPVGISPGGHSLLPSVEFPSRDWTPRPGRSFRGLHDTTDWREWAKEQIQNWERRGKGVKSSATMDDAYLQAYALKYGGKVYKSARCQWRELERVRRAATAGAFSSGVAGSSQSDLEDRLAAAVRRAEETQADLAEREIALRAATDRATEL